MQGVRLAGTMPPRSCGDARGQIQPVLEECDGDIRCDMPKDVQHTLTFFNGVAPQAPKPKAKKKARAKKAKAADEPTAD